MEFLVVLFFCVFCLPVSDGRLLLAFSNTCEPPRGDTCIAIRQCPYFNDLLDNSPLPRPRNVIKIIRDHQCGFKSNTPYVCCNRPTTLPPETTTEWRTEPSSSLVSSLVNHRNYHLLPQNVCGIIKADSRITNGRQAALNEYPWMVLVFYNSSDGVIDFRCGGTLINKRYVLTAAHCVSNQSVIGVRLGEYNVETLDDCESTTGYCAPPIQDFQIEKIVTHPDYNSKNHMNDIALIKINGETNFNQENIQPICLPIESDLTTRSSIVSGWGVTEDGYKSQTLLQVRMPIIPTAECQKLYQQYVPISKNQICAGGYQGRDSCGGDSGGPLKEIGKVNGNMRIVQYGIVSFGPRYCGAEGKPGIYTRVNSYMKWILDNLEEY